MEAHRNMSLKTKAGRFLYLLRKNSNICEGLTGLGLWWLTCNALIVFGFLCFVFSFFGNASA